MKSISVYVVIYDWRAISILETHKYNAHFLRKWKQKRLAMFMKAALFTSGVLRQANHKIWTHPRISFENTICPDSSMIN